MNGCKGNRLGAIMVLCGMLASSGALAAQGQPSRIGLVIGNSAYSALPPLPACLPASKNVANKLRALDFDVVERQDVTSGAMDAAIDRFSKKMDAAPDASVVVYLCGYAAGMNGRPFLLPVTANVRRPSDVMTQGILAKAMIDLLVRGKPSRGVLAMDLVQAGGVEGPVLDGLSAMPGPDGTGLIAVIAEPPAAGPTALSAALVAGLDAPGVTVGGLLDAVQAEMKGQPAAEIAALRQPGESRALAVNEPPPVVQPSETPATQGPPEPLPAFPDEGAMTDLDRRRVQEGLAGLGYYAAPVDGRFGPETRAAIRRFQHEIGAEMTGTITGEQAARLVGGH